MTAVRVDATLLACEMAVLRALELAAKRVGQARANGHNLPGDPWTWHQAGPPILGAAADKGLRGAWPTLRAVLENEPADPDTDAILTAVDTYTRNLLADRARHDRAALAAYLQVAREPR